MPASDFDKFFGEYIPQGTKICDPTTPTTEPYESHCEFSKITNFQQANGSCSQAEHIYATAAIAWQWLSGLLPSLCKVVGLNPIPEL